MAELLERGLEKHPVMAPTFNGLFVVGTCVPHGDVKKRLDLKIGDLSNLLKCLQGKVDKKNKAPQNGSSPGCEESPELKLPVTEAISVSARARKTPSKTGLSQRL